MSKAISRPVALLTAVLAAGGLLTGCGQQPSQVGAAAIIGDTSIPLSRVQQRLDTMLATDPAARDVLKQRKLDVQAREILSLDIRHALISAAARSTGATVDNRQVDAIVARQGGAERAAKNARDQLGIALFDTQGYLRQVRDELLLADVARRTIGGISVTFDQITTGSRAEADAYAKRLAADPSRAAAVLAEANAAGKPVQANGSLSAVADLQTATSSPLLTLPGNTVATFPSGQQGTQWSTIFVRERKTDNPVSQRDRAVLSTLNPSLLTQFGQLLLIDYAYRTSIRINPRYGVWDPINVQVAPSAGETVGSLFPVRNPAK